MASEIKVDTIVNAGGDNDSGIDLATNDKIGMKIANSEVVTVDTTGVVFNENSADRDFRVESDANTHGLFLEGSTGNVGIGTSSPLGLLHVSNTSGDCNNYFQSASTGLGQLLFTDGAIAGKISYRHPTNTMEFTTNGTEAMRITDSGGLLISCTTEPSNTTSGIFLRDNSEGGCKFSRGNATSLTTMLEFLNGNGSVGTIKTTGTSTQFNTSSDYRLKENVVTDWDATTRLKQLKPSRFNFITDANTTLDGFIAHEVANVVPESISGDKDAVDADGNIDPQGIDQSKLVPLLTKALQEAMAKIETLEAKVTALEGN